MELYIPAGAPQALDFIWILREVKSKAGGIGQKAVTECRITAETNETDIFKLT